MAKSLAKVQKKISKKKRKITSLHENSRDSQKLRRAGARSEKLERVSAARAKANQPHRKLMSTTSILLLNAHTMKYTESPFFRERQRWPRGLWSPKRYRFSSRGLLRPRTHIATILKFNRYLGRHDEEIEQLESERRPGRPSSNREDLLKQQLAIEAREYSAGFWLPDMEDNENLDLLRNWNGKWTSLSNFKYVRLTRAGTSSPSRFPPKGES